MNVESHGKHPKRSLSFPLRSRSAQAHRPDRMTRESLLLARCRMSEIGRCWGGVQAAAADLICLELPAAAREEMVVHAPAGIRGLSGHSPNSPSRSSSTGRITVDARRDLISVASAEHYRGQRGDIDRERQQGEPRNLQDLVDEPQIGRRVTPLQPRWPCPARDALGSRRR